MLHCRPALLQCNKLTCLLCGKACYAWAEGALRLSCLALVPPLGLLLLPCLLPLRSFVAATGSCRPPLPGSRQYMPACRQCKRDNKCGLPSSRQ